jgi:predicted small lipoprotein YifL
MKKIITLALALMFTISLAACGGNKPSGGNASTPPVNNAPSDGGNMTSSPDSQGNDGQSEAAAGDGFINIYGDPLALPETAPTIEEAVGVSVEGERIVRKYTDKFFDIVYKPDGCTVIYQVYEFDAETGEVSDSSLWYGGFTDGALFSEAFQKCLDQTFVEHIRGYNVSARYYGYYTWAAISDYDNDEVVTWDDAVAGGEYESDDNHILIV